MTYEFRCKFLHLLRCDYSQCLGLNPLCKVVDGHQKELLLGPSDQEWINYIHPPLGKQLGGIQCYEEQPEGRWSCLRGPRKPNNSRQSACCHLPWWANNNLLEPPGFKCSSIGVKSANSIVKLIQHILGFLL